jgi:hypothetical protein
MLVLLVPLLSNLPGRARTRRNREAPSCDAGARILVRVGPATQFSARAEMTDVTFVT